MSKLTLLGFSGPYNYTADGSVNGTYNGHPYNIHPSATSDIWAALQADITGGLVTVASYIAPPVISPTASETAVAQIRSLEATITQRRLRDALLTDAGKTWLSTIDAQIAALRATIV